MPDERLRPRDDDRFSLRDSELDLPPALPPTTPARLDALAEHNRLSWSHARERLDPSPRVDVARAFYRDALRARLRH